MDRIQELTIEEKRYIDVMVLRHAMSPSVSHYSDDKLLDYVITIMDAYAKWIIGSSKDSRMKIILSRI